MTSREVKLQNLRLAHEAAHRDLAHARAQLEEQVGDRLRAQQKIIFSVLRKCNGRALPRHATPDFLSGSGTWAVVLQAGFEVVAIKGDTVSIRALALPESGQAASTYGLPLSFLSMSDRDTAKVLRAEVRELKTRAKAHQAWEAGRQVKELDRELRSQQASIDRLQKRRDALNNLIQK